MSEWKRQGECNKCGFCCLFIAVSPIEISLPIEGAANQEGKIDYDYINARELALASSNGTEVDSLSVPSWLYSPCPQYGFDDMLCNIHSSKPKLCSDYPWTPEQVVGTPCSYYFEKTNEAGVTFRQGGQGSPHPGRTAEQDGKVVMDVSPYMNVPYPLIMPRRKEDVQAS